MRHDVSRVVPDGFARCRPTPAPLGPPFLWAHVHIFFCGRTRGSGERCIKEKAASRGAPRFGAVCHRSTCRAILAAQARFQADEEVFFSVLDDVHVLTTLPHAHVARSNHGKTPQKFGWPSASTTRKFSWSNVPAPPEVAHLGPDVWRSDKPPHERGFVVLGTPIGHPAFIQAWADERLQEARRILHKLPELPDLPCAWLLASTHPVPTTPCAPSLLRR